MNSSNLKAKSSCAAFACAAFMCALLTANSAQAQMPGAGPLPSPDPEITQLTFDAILDGMNGRTWLVTPDASFDAELVAYAKSARGVELVTIPIRGASHENVAKFHAAVKTLGNPRLTAAAYARPAQFAMSWLVEDPDGAAAKLALLNNATVPIATGFAALPDGLVYIACPTNKLDAATLKTAYAKFHALHEDVTDMLSARQITDKTAAQISAPERFLRRTLSIQGNNIGYLLRKAGLKNEAGRAFALAHSIDPDNISPLLNLASAVREGSKAGTPERISAQLGAWSKAGIVSWTLADTSGFVLRPDEFIPAKWWWVSSGIPFGETAVFDEYLAAVTDPAAADFLKSRAPVPIANVVTALRNQLDSVPALTGSYLLTCAQTALVDSEIARAKAALDAAEAAGVTDTELLARLKSGIHAASGNNSDAIAALESAKNEKNAAKILESLAATHFIAGDSDGMLKAVNELAALPDAPPWAEHLKKAITAKAAGNGETALASVDRAFEIAPKSVLVMSYALNLSWDVRDIERADKYAQTILALNPRDFFANYVRASILVNAKNYPAAEQHFVIAISANPAWFVLNDFAALLTETGKIEPALKLAEQSLKTGGENFGAVWDTYATLLRKTGKNEEAWNAWKTAIEKPDGNDPRIHLNFAEMAIERQDKETAAKSLAIIDPVKESLSIDERSRLGRIRAKLR